MPISGSQLESNGRTDDPRVEIKKSLDIDISTGRSGGVKKLLYQLYYKLLPPYTTWRVHSTRSGLKSMSFFVDPSQSKSESKHEFQYVPRWFSFISQQWGKSFDIDRNSLFGIKCIRCAKFQLALTHAKSHLHIMAQQIPQNNTNSSSPSSRHLHTIICELHPWKAMGLNNTKCFTTLSPASDRNWHRFALTCPTFDFYIKSMINFGSLVIYSVLIFCH